MEVSRRYRTIRSLSDLLGTRLSAGMYSTYEGLSSDLYRLGEGRGNVEYSVTTYPGTCLHDTDCWVNQEVK